MTKRVYDENGQWTEDAQLGSNMLYGRLRELMCDLGRDGFNPREAEALVIANAARIASAQVVAYAASRRGELSEGLAMAAFGKTDV